MYVYNDDVRKLWPLFFCFFPVRSVPKLLTPSCHFVFLRNLKGKNNDLQKKKKKVLLNVNTPIKHVSVKEDHTMTKLLDFMDRVMVCSPVQLKHITQ